MSRPAGGAALALLVLLSSSCAARRFLPFGEERDAALLVRHRETRSLEIWADEERLGVAEVGRIACFPKLRAGTYRLRATVVGDTTTVRATRAVLPPEQPMLWAVDHDQMLDGRVYARYCEDEGTG